MVEFPATACLVNRYARQITQPFSDPGEADRLGLVCQALAELSTGAVARWWSQLAQRHHNRALLLLAEQSSVRTQSPEQAA